MTMLPCEPHFAYLSSIHYDLCQPEILPCGHILKERYLDNMTRALVCSRSSSKLWLALASCLTLASMNSLEKQPSNVRIVCHTQTGCRSCNQKKNTLERALNDLQTSDGPNERHRCDKTVSVHISGNIYLAYNPYQRTHSANKNDL